MSDIKVTLQGDGSGAKEAFKDAGDGAHGFAEKMAHTAEQVHLMYEAVEKLGEQLVEFGKESFEAFEKTEKAFRMLERAAGENAEAFREQAQSMQEQLGVSDDVVMKMQTMLSTFGEAPEDIHATTMAILDYSARTGVDAVSATQMLESSAKTGRQAFKDLNLTYDNTGDAATRLTAITEALTAKIGGTALAEANTLEGAMRKAHEETDEFKKSLGEMISGFIEHTGAVSTFTEALRDLRLMLFGAKNDSLVHIQQNIDAAELDLKTMEERLRTAGQALIGGGAVESLKTDIATQQALIEQLKTKFAELAAVKRQANFEDQEHERQSNELSSLGHKEGKSPKAAKVEAEHHSLANLRQLERDEDAKQEQWDEDQRAKEFGSYEQGIEHSKKYYEEMLKVQQAGEKATIEEQDKAAHAAIEQQKKLDEEMKRQADRAQKDMEMAGAKIGKALIDAISSAIVEGIQGQEVDVLGVVADTAFSIGGMIAGAIASYYGGPAAGMLASSAVAGIGSIVHAERGRAFQNEQKGRNGAQSHHDGGWIEPESYHSGGWPPMGTTEVPAVLESGEAVFSRAEVARNGGRQGVDALRRGGGGQGLHITVVAQDSTSVREFFEDRGGRGVYNALKTGRGSLSNILNR